MEPTTYTGIVERGIKRGKALGFPTANISLEDKAISGVYAGQVRVEHTTYQAALFANRERKILEAYLLDFSGNLYGKEITMELHKKIRDSEKFTDEMDLIRQIKDDVVAIRAYFEKGPPKE